MIATQTHRAGPKKRSAAKGMVGGKTKAALKKESEGVAAPRFGKRFREGCEKSRKARRRAARKFGRAVPSETSEPRGLDA